MKKSYAFSFICFVIAGALGIIGLLPLKQEGIEVLGTFIVPGLIIGIFGIAALSPLLMYIASMLLLPLLLFFLIPSERFVGFSPILVLVCAVILHRMKKRLI